MKKFIVSIDDDGVIYDKNGANTGITISGWLLEEYQETVLDTTKENNEDTVVKLVSLGVSPDELIKMRAAGLL